MATHRIFWFHAFIQDTAAVDIEGCERRMDPFAVLVNRVAHRKVTSVRGLRLNKIMSHIVRLAEKLCKIFPMTEEQSFGQQLIVE